MKKIFLIVFLIFTINVFSLKVGITQIIEHPALNLIYEGIVDKLQEENIEIEVDHQNAQGLFQNAVIIAKKFNLECDYIIAITTPSAQAAKTEIKEKPLIFSAINDPIGAGLIEHYGKNNGNIAGISDMLPVETHLKLIKKVSPQAKNIAILYNPGEANSVLLVKKAKKISKNLDQNILDITGTNINEMITSINSNLNKIDAVYLITDNLAASGIEIISDIFYENKIPIFSSDIDMAKKSAVIGFGFDYYTFGKATADMLIELIDGKNIKEIESKLIDSKYLKLYINLSRAENCDIKISKKFLDNADMIQK
jgi:putative ABC transport system substrate-binding protein